MIRIRPSLTSSSSLPAGTARRRRRARTANGGSGSGTFPPPLLLLLLLGLGLLVVGTTHAPAIVVLPVVAAADGAEEAMRSFREGDAIPLYVNKLTSIQTQLPLDYYRLPFCRPGPRSSGDDDDDARELDQNFGQYLSGDRIRESPYEIRMLQESYCRVLCQIVFDRAEAALLGRPIKDGYHHNWILDNLPSAATGMNRYGDKIRRYAGGFPVGFVAPDDKKMSYVYNHVNIHVGYNKHRHGEGGDGDFRVVRFAVEPLSIKHRFKDGYEWDGMSRDAFDKPLETCTPVKHLTREDVQENQVVKHGESVLFTYDVLWEESDEPWSTRWGMFGVFGWIHCFCRIFFLFIRHLLTFARLRTPALHFPDIYLTEDHLVPLAVHLYSIANSAFIVVVFASFIALILVGNLRNNLNDDDNNNNNGNDDEHLRDQELEEKGLVVVDVDVFNPPSCAPLLLSLCCGTGAQLLFSALVTVAVASFGNGFLSPAHRGRFVQFGLVIVALMGIVNGYVTARFYRAFGGPADGHCARPAALAFPGMAFTVFLLTNVMTGMVHSTIAVPFWVLAVVAFFWLGISVPLVYLGAYFGSKHGTPLDILPPNCPRSILLSNIMNRRVLRKMSCRSWCCIVAILLLFNVVTIVLALLWLLRRFLLRRNCWSRTWSGAIMLLVGGVFGFGCVYVELFFIMTQLWMLQFYYSFGSLLLVLCLLTVTCCEVSIILNYYHLCSKEYHSWWWQFCYSGAVSVWIFIYSGFWFRALETSILLTFVVYAGFMICVCLSVFLMMGFAGVVASLCFVRIIFAIAKNGDDYRPLLSAEDNFGEDAAMELSSPPGDTAQCSSLQ